MTLGKSQSSFYLILPAGEQRLCSLDSDIGSGARVCCKNQALGFTIESLLPSRTLRTKLVAVDDFAPRCLISEHSGEDSPGKME